MKYKALIALLAFPRPQQICQKMNMSKCHVLKKYNFFLMTTKVLGRFVGVKKRAHRTC